MFATSPVVVLWLLALLGARACQRPGEQISGVAGDSRSYHIMHNYNVLQAHYEDRVDIFCSGTNVTTLSIHLRRAPEGVNGRQLKKVNETTLQLTIEKPVIGDYLYNCTDMETRCTSYLNVKVRPIITIESRRLHQKRIDNGIHYHVRIGEDFEVICSGTKERELRISEDVNTIQTISVNETTVKLLKLHDEKYLETEYRCFPLSKKEYYASVSVHIDFNPAAENFWCVIYGLQVNCFWIVRSMDTAFKLFFTGQRGNSMLVCEDHPKRERTGHCDWSIKKLSTRGIEPINNLTLIMQACNQFYCDNQTYFMNYDSIYKPVSPHGLGLLKRSSNGATLTWTEYAVHIPVLYKLTYRLPGMPTQQLDASLLLITCKSKRRFLMTFNFCEAQLRLPCPNAFYVIEVFTRFTSTPSTNEAYWSEPANVTFWTKPSKSTDEVDPACVKEPELIENKYVGVSEVKKLGRSVHKQGLALRRKMTLMEHKVDRIEALCHELALEDCKHFVLK